MAAMFGIMNGSEIAAAEPGRNPASIGCTCRRLRRMARLVTQLYDEALSKHDLTIAQFGLMATIAEHCANSGKDISIGALAIAMGLDPTTLNRNLNILQRLQLAEVRRDENDRRMRAVALTATGRQRLKGAVPAWRGAQADLERRLGSETLSALNDTLDRSRDRLIDTVRSAETRASHPAPARA